MTEAERHAFLSQLSQSSSTTPSPSQAQGFLETSFTATVALRQPPTGGPLRDKSSRSWDQAAEQILQSQGAGDAPVPEGFSNPEEMMYCETIKPQLTLPLSSEPVHAPLASPETLSMASGIIGGSLASGILGGLPQSESLRDSFRRSLNSPPPLNSPRQSGSGNPTVVVDLSADDSSVQVDTSRASGDGSSGPSDTPQPGDVSNKTVTVTQTPHPSNNPGHKQKPALQLDGDVARLPMLPTTCVRHSPVETTQGEYEHPNLHYSPASTGYPHGAYHPPIRYSPETIRGKADTEPSRSTSDQDGSVSLSPDYAQSETGVHPSKTFTNLPTKSTTHSVSGPTHPAPHPFVHCQSESSIFSKHFPPKLGMKRSAERSDICQLEDETEVFPSRSDLFTIKRSAELTDIPHLGDDLDVFEEGEEEEEDTCDISAILLEVCDAGEFCEGKV
nr:hypothetical protein BaRGS_023717 [Batillaria attramentaria]